VLELQGFGTDFQLRASRARVGVIKASGVRELHLNVQEAGLPTLGTLDPASQRRPAPPPSDDERLAALVRAELPFVWRVLRRLGMAESDADDAAQQVFVVAAKRLADIELGSERAFLFSTAMNVAAHARRSHERRREVPDVELEERRDSVPGLEEILDRRRAREMLDELLAAMPLELRVVFVLYEVEELTMAEIAKLVELPPGTVASRLRRAREDFAARLARLEAKMKYRGGGRP
jgi:RNA polymerase sigma-70 factor, ECF subfamily